MSEQEERSQELRSYILGYGLALVLTVIPFALVAWGGQGDGQGDGLSTAATLWTIAVFALLQIAVHFRFFLHIGLSGQKREDLQLILFSVLLVTIMAGGTIWIMANLHMRMM